jgi:hypothetical protein
MHINDGLRLESLGNDVLIAAIIQISKKSGQLQDKGIIIIKYWIFGDRALD